MRCLASPQSVRKDPFTPAIGVKHQCNNVVNTSPGNCSPVSNSSADVITASNPKRTTCHSSGYTNSTPFGKKSLVSCLSTS